MVGCLLWYSPWESWRPPDWCRYILVLVINLVNVNHSSASLCVIRRGGILNMMIVLIYVCATKGRRYGGFRHRRRFCRCYIHALQITSFKVCLRLMCVPSSRQASLNIPRHTIIYTRTGNTRYNNFYYIYIVSLISPMRYALIHIFLVLNFEGLW